MIENDFSALRTAVRDSAIGRATASLLSVVSSAALTASATGLVESGLTSFRELAAPAKIQLSATLLASACVATWALTQFVPPYVSTAIPRTTFLLMGLVCAAAAARADSLSDHWSRSKLRRFTLWLRGA
jgi:hypothetical protein